MVVVVPAPEVGVVVEATTVSLTGNWFRVSPGVLEAIWSRN